VDIQPDKRRRRLYSKLFLTEIETVQWFRINIKDVYFSSSSLIDVRRNMHHITIF